MSDTPLRKSPRKHRVTHALAHIDVVLCSVPSWRSTLMRERYQLVYQGAKDAKPDGDETLTLKGTSVKHGLDTLTTVGDRGEHG